MEYQKFIPEGWKNTEEEININMLKNAMQTGKIMQGIVSKCDENYDLHINFSNNIEGIIPKKEIDFKNYIRNNIVKNKENTFVQFKVKEINEDNSKVILSRKEVKEEALEWVKNDLKVGNIVSGIVKNMRPFGAFVEIGGGIVRTYTYRRYISFKNKITRRKILYWTKD